MSAKEFSLPFLQKDHVGKNTYAFSFGLTQSFSFLPGQYVRISLPHTDSDDRGTTRLFSIASSPHEIKKLTIVTKITESSFKQTLYKLTPGVDVQFFAPMGQFFFQEEKTHHVFLAGGIGITAFLSMLFHAVALKQPPLITLLVSFSAVDAMLYKNELARIIQQYPTIQVVYVLSGYPNSKWHGETGRISQSLIQKHVPWYKHAQFYTVGSADMVEDMGMVLKEMGIVEENILKEDFTGLID